MLFDKMDVEDFMWELFYIVQIAIALLWNIKPLKPGNKELYKWLLGRAISCRFHLQWWSGFKHTLILILAEVWWVCSLVSWSGCCRNGVGCAHRVSVWIDVVIAGRTIWPRALLTDSRCSQWDGTILCLRYHSCNYSLFFKHMHKTLSGSQNEIRFWYETFLPNV